MQQKSSKMTKTKAILTLLAGLSICLLLVGGILAIIFLPLRTNHGYVEGMQIVKNDPAVAEVFGTPIRGDLAVMGKLQGFKYGDSVGTLSTKIYRPKGVGDVGFFLTKPQGGDWQLDRMNIHQGQALVLIWDPQKADLGFQYYQQSPAPNTPTLAPPTPVP